MNERLILCGAGHIASALAPIAKLLEWDVLVVDDRQEFANQARFPGCETKAGSFAEVLEGVKTDERDHIVIVTRGHAGDQVCLAWALSVPHGYLGMIGSKTKIGTLKRNLKAQGLEPDWTKIHAPIGLSIGAQTPAEIAVAIAAQMIQWRYDEKVAEPPAPQGPGVVATIVAKHGSAPRGVGAWLMLRPDGTFEGTVGGGAVEGAVCAKLTELQGQDFAPFRVHYDLSNRDAAGLGMACGGNVDVEFKRQ